jgi:hypothetical protein
MAMLRLVPLFLVVLTSACVVPIETRISSSGEADTRIAGFIWGSEVRSSEGNMAREAVGAKLALLGIVQAENAPLRLDVTFSTLPASLKLLPEEGAKTAGKAKPPRNSKKCDPMEYRLGISFARISDGAIVYRASAAEYHCNGKASSVIPLLADMALKDLGKPKGRYWVERKP